MSDVFLADANYVWHYRGGRYAVPAAADKCLREPLFLNRLTHFAAEEVRRGGSAEGFLLGVSDAALLRFAPGTDDVVERTPFDVTPHVGRLAEAADRIGWSAKGPTPPPPPPPPSRGEDV